MMCLFCSIYIMKEEIVAALHFRLTAKTRESPFQCGKGRRWLGVCMDWKTTDSSKESQYSDEISVTTIQYRFSVSWHRLKESVASTWSGPLMQVATGWRPSHYGHHNECVEVTIRERQQQQAGHLRTYLSTPSTHKKVDCHTIYRWIRSGQVRSGQVRETS